MPLNYLMSQSTKQYNEQLTELLLVLQIHFSIASVDRSTIWAGLVF